jgi:hypothetical protein
VRHDVTLEIKKKSDGAAVLTFVRADGSRTSSPIGAAGGFGPVHDLSHYVVESVLGIGRGFIGLCAEGWSVQDFDKNAAKNIPPEAAISEAVSGEISRMEAMSQWSTCEDFNWTIGGTGATITVEQYDAIRRALASLRARWNGLEPGATMSLRFEPGRAVKVNDEGTIS